jgi:hypothetical protein
MDELKDMTWERMREHNFHDLIFLKRKLRIKSTFEK